MKKLIIFLLLVGFAASAAAMDSDSEESAIATPQSVDFSAYSSDGSGSEDSEDDLDFAPPPALRRRIGQGFVPVARGREGAPVFSFSSQQQSGTGDGGLDVQVEDGLDDADADVDDGVNIADARQLRDAARTGNVAGVRELLNSMPDDAVRVALIEDLGSDGYGVLVAAAQAGHVDVVRELLRHLPVNIEHEWSAWGLCGSGLRASREAGLAGHFDVVRELFNHMSNDTARRVLIENRYDAVGSTALHVAVNSRHIEMVQAVLNRLSYDLRCMLIQMGDFEGTLPSALAERIGAIAIVNLLQGYIDRNGAHPPQE